MNATIINRGRGPEIAGTRITVYNILDYLEAGWHHTLIAATLRISSSQVLAAANYIEAHKDEVMPKYRKMLERAAQGNPPEVEERRLRTRAKLLAELERIRNRKKEEHEGAVSGQ